MLKSWVISAVVSELGLLIRELQAVPLETGHPFPVYGASLHGMPIRLATLGIGVAATALGLGTLHRDIRSAEVIMVGSGGALPGSGLAKGDLAVAVSETLSELGVVTGPGTADARLLDLPGVQQQAALDPGLTAKIRDAAAGLAKTEAGPFLTVLGPSGTRDQAESRAAAFHAIAENMEGYALGLAARQLGFAAAEIRGISNLAGDRDKRNWDLEQAQELAQAAVLNYLKENG